MREPFEIASKSRCSYEKLKNGKYRVTFLNPDTGKYESNCIEPELSKGHVKRRIEFIERSWDLKYGVNSE